jgi:hypothetical protein
MMPIKPLSVRPSYSSAADIIAGASWRAVAALSVRLRPRSRVSVGAWVDCTTKTFIPVHDQSITAVSKNHRPSINTQIIISAHRRRVVTVGNCWPGNRNDVIVARHTVAHFLTVSA